MKRIALLFLLFILLVGCAAPTTLPTPTAAPTATNTPRPTATITPSPTQQPYWLTPIETQDSKDKFVKVVDGKPNVDLYDTKSQESIVLNENTIKALATTDGLNPNILTAQDAEGNTYAFNPDLGWFKLPGVQMDYTKLAEYTEVEQSFIEDGRANIVTALKYAENPTISPDAVAPQYWANFGADGGSYFIFLGYRPSSLVEAGKLWPDLTTNFKAENKPFSWTGFYKVKLYNNQSAYVIGRTIKTDNNQTTNLFYGFDQKAYENKANDMLTSGKTELTRMFEGINNGGMDLIAILAPPDIDINGKSLLWYPDLVHRGDSTYPDVARLQKRGELISLFSPEDQKTILDVLSQTPVEILPGVKEPLRISPIFRLPPELSKTILLPGRS